MPDPLSRVPFVLSLPAASDRVTVAKLADILNVDVPTLRCVIACMRRRVEWNCSKPAGGVQVVTRACCAVTSCCRLL